ncbi:hypothetical protein TURU_006196 [Turdus rufiventris]|nr:hypothetical protein TURU_006196 [Turdus rufiventris]
MRLIIRAACTREITLLQEIPRDPLPELVWVPLDGIPCFRSVNFTTQLGVFCKFAGGAFDHFVYAIDEGTEQQ